jgi:hypothetical protein
MAAIEQQQLILSAKVQKRLLLNYLLTIESGYVQEYVQEDVQQYLISESDAARIKKLLNAMISSLTDA